MWPQPGALGSVVVATEPMTGVMTLTNLPLTTTHEGVLCRLEMQRQVDEISAAQCSYSAKSASQADVVLIMVPADGKLHHGDRQGEPQGC